MSKLIKKFLMPATVLGLLPVFTGCLTHTHSVRRARPAPIVMNATLEDLIKRVNIHFDAIQTMSANVEISATTGGSERGEVTESPNFSGYIFLRKPRDLQVLLKVPILGSVALDMVSDGHTFKLLIPPRNKAVIGTEEITQPSKNGLENLRPAVFFDSLLVQGPAPEQIVSLTSDVRVIEPENKKSDLIEEPDYDLEVLAPPIGNTARALRVIHIGRSSLQPYQQDIYDSTGRIATRAFYSNYQIFGTTLFPAKIVIKRPLDQYSLTVTITKLTFNDKLEDDQFDLKIPENIQIQQMK